MRKIIAHSAETGQIDRVAIIRNRINGSSSIPDSSKNRLIKACLKHKLLPNQVYTIIDTLREMKGQYVYKTIDRLIELLEHTQNTPLALSVFHAFITPTTNACEEVGITAPVNIINIAKALVEIEQNSILIQALNRLPYRFAAQWPEPFNVVYKTIQTISKSKAFINTNCTASLAFMVDQCKTLPELTHTLKAYANLVLNISKRELIAGNRTLWTIIRTIARNGNNKNIAFSRLGTIIEKMPEALLKHRDFWRAIKKLVENKALQTPRILGVPLVLLERNADKAADINFWESVYIPTIQPIIIASCPDDYETARQFAIDLEIMLRRTYPTPIYSTSYWQDVIAQTVIPNIKSTPFTNLYCFPETIQSLTVTLSNARDGDNPLPHELIREIDALVGAIKEQEQMRKECSEAINAYFARTANYHNDPDFWRQSFPAYIGLLTDLSKTQHAIIKAPNKRLVSLVTAAISKVNSTEMSINDFVTLLIANNSILPGSIYMYEALVQMQFSILDIFNIQAGMHSFLTMLKKQYGNNIEKQVNIFISLNAYIKGLRNGYHDKLVLLKDPERWAIITKHVITHQPAYSPFIITASDFIDALNQQ